MTYVYVQVTKLMTLVSLEQKRKQFDVIDPQKKEVRVVGRANKKSYFDKEDCCFASYFLVTVKVGYF